MARRRKKKATPNAAAASAETVTAPAFAGPRCPDCATPFSDAQLLDSPSADSSVYAPFDTWCCSACLTVAIRTAEAPLSTRLLGGSAVARVIERLRRAVEEDRLAEEASAVAEDPETWFVARVPAAFALFDWKGRGRVRLLERSIVNLPEPSASVVVINNDWAHMDDYEPAPPPPDYGVIWRPERHRPAVAGPATPISGWDRAVFTLDAGFELDVIVASAPVLTLRFAEGTLPERLAGYDRFLAYADALLPAD